MVVAVVVVVVVVLLLLLVICFIPPPTSSRFRLYIKQDLLELRILNSSLLFLPVSRLNLRNIAVSWVAFLIRIRFMIRIRIWSDRLLVLIPKVNGFPRINAGQILKLSQGRFFPQPPQLSASSYHLQMQTELY